MSRTAIRDVAWVCRVAPARAVGVAGGGLGSAENNQMRFSESLQRPRPFATARRACRRRRVDRRRVVMRSGVVIGTDRRDRDATRVLEQRTEDRVRWMDDGRNDDAEDDGVVTTTSVSQPSGGGVFGVARALSDATHGPTLRKALLFTLLREFKPSEPFLVATYVNHGFAASHVTSQIFPAWAYARVPSLVLMACSAKRFGCKATVLSGTAAACFTVLVTLLVQHGTSLSDCLLIASQASAAFSNASHQAFLGLTFATLPRRIHPAAAHGVKAVALLGNAGSSLCGQVLWGAGYQKSVFVTTLAAQLVSGFVATLFTEHEGEGEGAAASNGENDCNAESLSLPSDVQQPWGFEKSGHGHKNNPAQRWSATRAVSRALKNPRVFLWCLWSVSCAPTHAFVAGNWQLLFVGGLDEAFGKDSSPGVRSNDKGFKNDGFFLAATQIAAFAATLAVGGLAYRKGTDQVGRERRTTLPSVISLVWSMAVMALAIFLAGFGWRSTCADAISRCAVVLFVCVFESTSSVCAACLGTEARQVAGASSIPDAASDVDETQVDSELVLDPNADDGDGLCRARETRTPFSESSATRLALLFALLSAAGYCVEWMTQAVTDFAHLTIQKRFQLRAGGLLVFTGVVFAARRVCVSRRARLAAAGEESRGDELADPLLCGKSEHE